MQLYTQEYWQWYRGCKSEPREGNTREIVIQLKLYGHSTSIATKIHACVKREWDCWGPEPRKMVLARVDDYRVLIIAGYIGFQLPSDVRNRP